MEITHKDNYNPKEAKGFREVTDRVIRSFSYDTIGKIKDKTESVQDILVNLLEILTVKGILEEGDLENILNLKGIKLIK